MKLKENKGVSMDEKRGFSCKLYVRAEQLKAHFSHKEASKNYFHEHNLWGELQELSKIYKKLILSDIVYALDKKVEVDLWNYCFKNFITHLQLQVKNAHISASGNLNRTTKTNFQSTSQGGVRRAAELAGSDPNITLQWFLETANGYFILLLEEICAIYDYSLPFLKRGSNLSVTNVKATIIKAAAFKTLKAEVTYICQFCLVHLGDICRYQNEFKKAEIFYRQAIHTSPASGQAYNQIALLHANYGNTLSAISYYIRSISLKHPFPAGSANLSKILASSSTIATDISNLSINKSNFLSEYVRFHAYLHEAGNLRMAYDLCNILNQSITSLVATECLTTLQLIQMTTIAIFQIERVSDNSVDPLRDIGDDEKYNELELLSTEEKVIRNLTVESIAGMLNAFLLPVYTLMKGKSFLDYFALPATKILLDWIVINPKILAEPGFLKRMQIWPSLCKVLNELSDSVTHTNLSLDVFDGEAKYCPLPEDYDLCEFSPLQKRLSTYKYDNKKLQSKHLTKDRILLLRAQRILEAGKLISSIKIINEQPVINVVNEKEGSDEPKNFKAVENIAPNDVGDDILIELEKLTLNKKFSDTEECDDSNMETTNKGPLEIAKPDKTQTDISFSNFSEFTEQEDPIVNSSVSKRGQRTNVAMTAIMKQAAAAANIDKQDCDIKGISASQKHVKFNAPSPVTIGFPQESPNVIRRNSPGELKQKYDVGSELSMVNQTSKNYFGQKGMDGKETNFPIKYPMDFSVPPPSLSSGLNQNLGFIGKGDENTHLVASRMPGIPKSVSDSTIPVNFHQIHRPQLQTNNTRSMQPNAFSRGPLPPSMSQIQSPSSIWQTSAQTNADLLHSHSNNPGQFQYQLPRFGGLNKPEQTITSINRALPNPSRSVIDSGRMQFQHPYPMSEVSNEMKNSSTDANSNRSSPMYHRLFSMDPTWSVTPGSLPTTNSDNEKSVASNFSDRSK